MDASRWERWAAGTGIGFVVLLLVGSFLPGQPPTPDDPIEEVIDFAVDKREALLAGSYLAGLSVVLGLWFAGSIRSFLRRAEGGEGRLSAVAFGGAVASGGVVLVQNAVGNAITVRVAEEGNAAVVRALFDMATILVASIWFPVAVWVGAASVVALRTGVFPRWYGQAGLVLTLAFLVAGTGIYIEDGPLVSGGPYSLVAFLLFALWALVTSVLMIQRLGEPGTRGAPVSRLGPD